MTDYKEKETLDHPMKTNTHSLIDRFSQVQVSPDVRGTLFPEIDASIQKRFTCEMGGVRFCLAHCLALGYRGAWCDSRNVCHCR
ncbi:U-Asilidin(12)-Dg3b-like [Crassostrea angulata]|uniref:U-Asilidin(12)-Dg3b-like n=1 Tax=Magallana angulata TaxID=2784310 RepID=UPI0022B176FA|nr:U-Asilidin(12)-Dg3b-like [Crassostrea angulata]